MLPKLSLQIFFITVYKIIAYMISRVLQAFDLSMLVKISQCCSKAEARLAFIDDVLKAKFVSIN